MKIGVNWLYVSHEKAYQLQLLGLAVVSYVELATKREPYQCADMVRH